MLSRLPDERRARDKKCQKNPEQVAVALLLAVVKLSEVLPDFRSGPRSNGSWPRLQNSETKDIVRHVRKRATDNTWRLRMLPRRIGASQRIGQLCSACAEPNKCGGGSAVLI
jgi:hypothetical protein